MYSEAMFTSYKMVSDKMSRNVKSLPRHKNSEAHQSDQLEPYFHKGGVLYASKLFTRRDVIGGQDNQFSQSTPSSFHSAMSTVLVTAQCFGILPVVGVKGSNPSSLQHKPWAMRRIYAHALLACCTVIELLAIAHMYYMLKLHSSNFMRHIGPATAGVVFYGNGCVAAILFLRLCNKWPALMKTWYSTENRMGSVCFQGYTRRINACAGIIMVIAVGEHILSIMVNIPEHIKPGIEHANPCPLDDVTINMSAMSLPSRYFKSYCCNSHQFIFTTVPYTTWFGVFVFVVSKIATFAWNFQDVFIILISIGLTQRYKQINAKIARAFGRHLTKHEWQELREHLATVSALVHQVDDAISGIVLLSFANNLYFICLQLLNGINPDMTSWVEYTYFIGSFLFLLGRAIAVTMFAAAIHDQSKVGLPPIYNCPSSSYCVEVERLQFQLMYDECCLTGLKFFAITRNFMLAVAGAIFTYEIVLIQFK